MGDSNLLIAVPHSPEYNKKRNHPYAVLDKRESVKYNIIKSIPVHSVCLQVRTRTCYEEACQFKDVLHDKALIMRNVP